MLVSTNPRAHLFFSDSSCPLLCLAAAFLREELAIRLSHRVRDLQELPDGLSEMENVKLVRGWYAESFDELVK
jgi:pyruvate dehydrogenase kinase 2/3/4